METQNLIECKFLYKTTDFSGFPSATQGNSSLDCLPVKLSVGWNQTTIGGSSVNEGGAIDLRDF
jgi:hypothetical protein